MSGGRHTGIVTHLDAELDHGEITAPGFGPHSCTVAELRRIGADKLGAVVEFAFGTSVRFIRTNRALHALTNRNR